jgi:hypothetical protein
MSAEATVGLALAAGPAIVRRGAAVVKGPPARPAGAGRPHRTPDATADHGPTVRVPPARVEARRVG